jgi:hypothetical protein
MEEFFNSIVSLIDSSNSLIFTMVSVLFLFFAFIVFIRFLANDGIDDLVGKILFFIMIVIFGLSIIYKFFQVKDFNDSPEKNKIINQEKTKKQDETRDVLINDQTLKDKNEKKYPAQNNVSSENINELKKDYFVKNDMDSINNNNQNKLQNKEAEKPKQVIPNFLR